jgi:predicted transcriptional regulator of viral defense system
VNRLGQYEMQIAEVLQKLKQLNQACIQTRDAAAFLHLTTLQASKVLERLAKYNHLIHINRGLWAFPEKIDPLILPEYLTIPFPSYISLQTALYHYGMISQLPTVIYAVSLARTKVISTPLAEFSIHHLDANFFFGFELLPGTFIKMATPEKALIDILYLSAAKTRLFRSLPEIELPIKFNLKTAQSIIARIPSLRRRAMVAARFTKVLSEIRRKI